jgi:exonuclease VII small subunit
VKGSGHGETPANGETVRGQSFEFRASALVELGRRVDQARAELEPAQAAYEEACRRWQQAVERLPAANGLLTNGLAQAVTAGGPDGA